MIIDNTTTDLTPEQRTIFAGEVLLLKNDQGMMTATQAVVHEIRKMTPSEKVTNGWDVHQSVLDALPDMLPEIGVPSNAPLPARFPNPFG